jgi:phosphomannomutase
LEFDCGVNITASHNPKEYNGIKIVAANAHSICGHELQIIRELVEKEDFHKPKIKGQLKKENIWPAYRDKLLSKIDRIKNPLKVVVDAGNGSAGPFAPELLSKTGANIIPLFCEPDGNFPNHEANPEDLTNMKAIIDKVLETGADIGIGFDGDGDRIGIIDEKGQHYSSDYLLLLLTKDLLSRFVGTPNNPNPQIVFDVKVSQAIINKMEELGAVPVMSKTGHSFIEKKMKEIHAPLAGEVSGHMFFGENYYGFDDAFLAALKLIEILSKIDEPFSTLFTDLPKTFMTPEFKAHCPDDKKFAIVEELSKHFTQIYDCITIDGVRVKFTPLSWGAVRASNTSPNLTLRFEAETPEKLKEIQTTMYEEIRKHTEVDLSWYKP